MREKLQNFGGAMFTPIVFFTFFGLFVSICSIALNPLIVGGLADEGTLWYGIWLILQRASHTIFNNIELLFVISLPLGLAKKAPGRAAVEAFVVYLCFNTLVSNMLDLYGPFFGVNFQEEGIVGVKMIGGIRTLDTAIIGSIVVALIVVWVHDKFFDQRIPEILGIFQGTALVTMIAFLLMIPLAFLTCLVWPKIQIGINSFQTLIVATGIFGVGIYAFLERALIPTGLHHFVWMPFLFGPAVVEEGLSPYFYSHLHEFALSTQPLIEIFPGGVFGSQAFGKLFAPIGIAAAFYFTSKPEKRKRVLTIMIPVTFAALITGITEPFEFTFLLTAPLLFIVYSLLSAILAMIMSYFGVIFWGSGLLDITAKTFIPMFANHWQMILTGIVIGTLFTFVYFFVFRYLILKFDFATPGREADDEIKMYSSKEFKDSKASKVKTGSNGYSDQAAGYLKALGGKENIESVNNCATRLRIVVRDETKVLSDSAFKEWGAYGVVRKVGSTSFQVIIGKDVGNIREEFDKLVK